MKAINLDNLDMNKKLPRRIRKIIVEKKRRDRIDGCLKQIKELLFRGTEYEKDYMRMEKADILENVLQFIKHTSQQSSTQSSTERQTTTDKQSSSMSPYQQGYVQCMKEVTQVMDDICTNYSTTHTLQQHMNSKINSMDTTLSRNSKNTTSTQHRHMSQITAPGQPKLSDTAMLYQHYLNVSALSYVPISYSGPHFNPNTSSSLYPLQVLTKETHTRSDSFSQESVKKNGDTVKVLADSTSSSNLLTTVPDISIKQELNNITASTWRPW